MKIKVISIGGSKVEFVSKYGVAAGTWKDRITPELKEYCVELDVKKIINFEEININYQKELTIKSVSNGIFISGLLNEYDMDGCATLKFEDNLVVIETVYNENFFSKCGNYISFIVPDIQIYDEHI